jgi:hypothetical protein
MSQSTLNTNIQGVLVHHQECQLPGGYTVLQSAGVSGSIACTVQQISMLDYNQSQIRMAGPW